MCYEDSVVSPSYLNLLVASNILWTVRNLLIYYMSANWVFILFKANFKNFFLNSDICSKSSVPDGNFCLYPNVKFCLIFSLPWSLLFISLVEGNSYTSKHKSTWHFRTFMSIVLKTEANIKQCWVIVGW